MMKRDGPTRRAKDRSRLHLFLFFIYISYLFEIVGPHFCWMKGAEDVKRDFFFLNISFENRCLFRCAEL